MEIKYKEVKFNVISNIEEVLPVIFCASIGGLYCRKYVFKDMNFCLADGTDIENGTIDYIYSDLDDSDEFKLWITMEQVEELVSTGFANKNLYTDRNRAVAKQAEYREQQKRRQEETERELYEKMKKKFDPENKKDSE